MADSGLSLDPLFHPRQLRGSPSRSVLDWLTAATVEHVTFYGYGKWALHDGLSSLYHDDGEYTSTQSECWEHKLLV